MPLAVLDVGAFTNRINLGLSSADAAAIGQRIYTIHSETRVPLAILSSRASFHLGRCTSPGPGCYPMGRSALFLSW
jgi:hypothetical protein